MAEEKHSFQGENVQVAVEREPGCKVLFTITVTADQTKQLYKQAVKSISKEVSLPGFRKGKAPEKLIISHYTQHVDREWRDKVLNWAFSEAIKLTNIQPFHENVVQKPEVKSLSVEEGAEFSIRFESNPELPEVEWKSIEISRPDKLEVKEEDVEKRVEELRYYHTDWQDITDRAAQEGDFVDIDIDALETPSYNICSDTRFELVDGKVPPWLRSLVVGLKPGETAEGMSEPDPARTDKEEEFKPTNCRVTLKAIKEARLPDINDELAKKAGVDTVEQLRERIKESLDREAELSVQEKLRKQLEDKILELAPTELPLSVLEAEKSIRMKNMQQALTDAPGSDEELREEVARLEEKARSEAERFLRLFYLTRPIVDEHKIEVYQQELMKELTHQMNAVPKEECGIDVEMEADSLRFKLYALITIRKAEDALLEKVQIV